MSSVVPGRKQPASTPPAPVTRRTRSGPRRSPRGQIDRGALGRDVQRFLRLLRTDAQLVFLRGERSVVLAGLEAALRDRPAEQTTIEMSELARAIVPRVVTTPLRRLARQLLEDCLRFRSWRPADRRALQTALHLLGLTSHDGTFERNPVWIAIMALSIEDIVALERCLIPIGRDTDEPLQSEGGEPRHLLYQSLFAAAHKVARLITDEKLQVVVRLYEILPVFLAVFQVWAEKSAYGQLPAETLPTLHGDVIRAFHRAAARAIDPDVVTAVATALEAEAERVELEGAQEQLAADLRAAARFTGLVPWERNPIVTQLLLRLCSTPEICCIGPGAAEAIKLAGDPTVADFYHGYGQALLRQGQLRAAGRVFSSGLDLTGPNWRGLLDLALVYRALGEEKSAKKTFREALCAGDTDARARALIRYEMAEAKAVRAV